MTHKSFLPFLAIVLAGVLAACGGKNDADFVSLDQTWDSSDNAFNTEYSAVRAQHDAMMAKFQAIAADTSFPADKRTAAQAKLDEHNKMLTEMETKRAEARAKRDAARTAKDRAAYDAAQREADYAAWRASLERIRTDQKDLEGQIMIGTKSVGGVDVNLKDKNEPLIRVEPGKNDTNTLIRVEPGKKDDKPLIEKNKNP
jgi:multidrug efflux pump subunit AcrA (membrane-fusion protein)